MNLNRNVVVPLTALVLFGFGYGIAALIGLFWTGMPVFVRWAIPILLVLWYFYDVVQREKPQT